MQDAFARFLGIELLEMADRTYVMESDQVVLGGAADELACDERVQTAYLGRV
jgi:ABC-type lipopolysaccharide export system ATPase subunit